MTSYSRSLSNSFIEKVVNGFSGPLNTARPIDITALERSRVNEVIKKRFDEGLQGLDSPESVGLVEPTPPAPPSNPGWTFITAPEDVSWDIANQATRVDIFGTNNPPVVAGSRGMRDLTLSNSLVEGFMRGVTVEGKIAALENLMNYGLNASEGFVSVPVYQVWADKKQYAGAQGYFVIKDVKVKETMRDTTGQTTRAFVDISLMQVPAYQVNSGRDQASKGTAGGVALTPEQKAQAQKNAAAAAAAQVDGNKNKNATASPAGPNAGGPSEPAKVPASSAPPTRGRQNIPGVGDNG
jgi:hypothetical protein